MDWNVVVAFVLGALFGITTILIAVFAGFKDD